MLAKNLTSRTRLPSGGSPLSPARTYVKCPQGSFLRLCIFVMQENRMSIHSIMRETHCRYRQIDPPASAFATQFRPATGVPADPKQDHWRVWLFVFRTPSWACSSASMAPCVKACSPSPKDSCLKLCQLTVVRNLRQ